MLSFSSPTWQSSLLAASKSSSKSSTNKTSSASAGPPGHAASEIIPRLYLTDLFTARNEAELVRLGITHIVSVIEHEPSFPEIAEGMKKLHIRVADRAEADLGVHLEETTRWIGDALAEEGNRVMVHCFMGVSRSATVVCAYLVATMSMTAPESISFVQSKRGIVCPNLGFRHQLEAYEERCNGSVNGSVKDGKRRSKRTTSRIGDGMAARITRFKEVAMGHGGGSRHANGIGSHGGGGGGGLGGSSSKQSLVVLDAVEVPRADGAEDGAIKT